jgi:peptidoglycan/xylan/chitin deacetylase (PgdA/CDA1 family)
MRREIREASRTLESLTGRPVLFFRPPVGHKNLFLGDALHGAGLSVVTWSVRPFDTLDRSPERIAQIVTAATTPGGIVLLHEGVRRSPGEPSRTVAALPSIIRGLREKGLEPVSLGSLLEAPFPPQGFSFGGSRPPQELGGS